MKITLQSPTQHSNTNGTYTFENRYSLFFFCSRLGGDRDARSLEYNTVVFILQLVLLLRNPRYSCTFLRHLGTKLLALLYVIHWVLNFATMSSKLCRCFDVASIAFVEIRAVLLRANRFGVFITPFSQTTRYRTAQHQTYGSRRNSSNMQQCQLPTETHL